MTASKSDFNIDMYTCAYVAYDVCLFVSLSMCVRVHICKHQAMYGCIVYVYVYVCVYNRRFKKIDEKKILVN